jgi:hypothetical protein
MRVLYIVLKRVHLIQSKPYSFWTDSNSPVVHAASKSGVWREETVTRRPASTARIFFGSYSLPHACMYVHTHARMYAGVVAKNRWAASVAY